MKNEKWVLATSRGQTYYNGKRAQGWGHNEVHRAMDIDSEYIFDSRDEAEELQMENRGLTYWFKVVKMPSLIKKPLNPYDAPKRLVPEIRYGTRSEVCGVCGTNILADEPYLIWKDGKMYCLHCVMTQLREVDQLFGRTPAELKEEWQASKKVRFKRVLKGHER